MERAKKTGVKPGPLLTRPKLKVQDVSYLDFFNTLAGARTMGMSAPNPIQVSEVLALCCLQGIASIEDKSKYLQTTQRLDIAYRAHWADQQPRN